MLLANRKGYLMIFLLKKYKKPKDTITHFELIKQTLKDVWQKY